MHDPMVVAFDIKIPVPHFRSKAKADQKRWSFQVWRRTNDANRGERCHAWWRPKGYRVAIAGRQLRWRTIATIWHVEPNGHDALTICRKRVPLDKARWWHRHAPWWTRIVSTKPVQTADGWEERVTGVWGYYSTGWHWHIRHWKVQIPLRQNWNRWRHSRCAKCGRRFTWGYAPVSHQWDGDGPSRKGEKGVFHHECATIISLQTSIGQGHEAIRTLFHAARVSLDLTEPEMIARLYTAKGVDFTKHFHVKSTIERALGWEFDHHQSIFTDVYELVKKETGERLRPYEVATAKGWRQ